MGKQGPCYHCGVTSTPLWRNGPPEKPVLCNACGSRWRTKGTLANYTPLHARIDADDYEDNRISKVKSISLKKRDEKLHKRKLSYESYMGGRLPADLNHSVQKSIDEDTSYRSSSGSAISNSDNSAQFGSGGDASDLTGPAYSNTWEKQVPSRKRTCVTRPKQSPVEKLTKDLRTILHEQSFYLAASPEDDLLFESDRPMVSVEIGHGSVLMKHPSSLGREEESEASSLSVENKHCADSEAYYHSTSLSGYNDCKGDNIHFQGDENFKKISNQMIKQETAKREKFSHERMQQLWHCNSPLHSIDLKDVVNFEVLVGYLTREEQHHLLRYLPSTDTYSNPDGLRSMFESRFFKEDISSFQQLVAEGLFSNTFSEVDAGDLKSLKKLVLSNLSKSKWLELYAKLKENRSTCDIGELSSIVASGGLSTSERSTGIGKKRHDPDNWNMPETKPTIKSPIRRIIIKNRHPEIKKEPSEAAGSYFSSKSLLETMPASGDGQLLMLDSYQFADESSDQDILLDIPANGSFPEAEFLLPSSGFTSGQPSASSSSFHPMFHP